MSRLSFSHVLLVSFLLIAAILGAVSLGGLVTLEDFAARSRNGASDALGFTAAMQELGERTVDMERSARQYLVLDDPVLRERFVQSHLDALRALAQIAALGTDHASTLAQEWREAAQATAKELDVRPVEEQPLRSLAKLGPINASLSAEIRNQIDTVNRALLDELDSNRHQLAWHVFAAIAAAFCLAGVTGWWVLRPLKRVEAAIEDLGESRFEQAFVIGGPADLRHVGRRLDWLRVRLADLEANRSRILRHVSHELKTPLASLREGAALLEDGVVGALTGEQREVVGILKHNCRLLQTRIEGLLGYNAAIFDAHSLKRRRCKLRPLLEDIVAEQQLTIQTRKLLVTIEGDLPPLEIDPDKLQIVMTNLVANAVSFSPMHGAIRLIIGKRPGWVFVDCIDQGPGIPPEESERVFEPFFQGSRQPDLPRNGSGLGLSIVHEFVAAHGGTVTLVPTKVGAHFRVELPDES